MSQTTTPLRRARQGSGATLRTGAKRAGVPAPKLSNWETGQRRVPPDVGAAVIRAVAMGMPRPGDHVWYLVGYDVVGPRWLTNDHRRVVAFAGADTAAAAADVLERISCPG